MNRSPSRKSRSQGLKAKDMELPHSGCRLLTEDCYLFKINMNRYIHCNGSIRVRARRIPIGQQRPLRIDSCPRFYGIWQTDNVPLFQRQVSPDGGKEESKTQLTPNSAFSRSKSSS